MRNDLLRRKRTRGKFPTGAAAEFKYITPPPPNPNPTPVVVTKNPELSFNGGEVVGAILTVIAPEYEGGPPVQALVTRLYTSTGDFNTNRVLYGTYTAPITAPAEWANLIVRAETTIVDIEGSQVYVSDPSGVIDDGEEPLPVPPQPQDDDWLVTARVAQPPDAATRYVAEYEWIGEGTPEEVEWLNDPVADFGEPSTYEHLWRPCGLDGNKWVHKASDGITDFTRINGNPGLHFRLRYKLNSAGPFSATSLDKKQGPSQATPPPSTVAKWHTASLTTAENAAQGRVGMSGGQRIMLSARAKSDPSVIVGFPDIYGIIISYDNGQSFRPPSQQGLITPYVVGGAIDPADDKVIIFAGCTVFFAEVSGENGIYRTDDGGKTFERTMHRPAMDARRVNRGRLFAYDMPNEDTQTPLTRRWLGVLNNAIGAAWEVVESTDGGQSWNVVDTLAFGTFGNITDICAHPSVAGCFYISSKRGVWRTTNYGRDWTDLTAGAMPTFVKGGANVCLGVEINPEAGSIATTEMYIMVGCEQLNQNSGGTGYYRSTNGGASATKLAGVPGNPNRLYVAFNSSGNWDPVGSRVMYSVGRGTSLRRTANGGASWQTVSVAGIPAAYENLGGNITDPNSNNGNPQFDTTILPHPTNPNELWATSASFVWRSTNAGLSWQPAGDYIEFANWQIGQAGISFCEGNVTGAENRVLIGVTDYGLYIGDFDPTKDIDEFPLTFHFSRISYELPNGQDRTSSNATAQCPNDLNHIRATCGYSSGGLAASAWMHTDQPKPHNHASGDWIASDVIDGYPIHGRWHAQNPAICYTTNGRFTNAKVNNNHVNFQGGGFLLDIFPADNDIIYIKTGGAQGVPVKIRKSVNAGATVVDYVEPGWDPTFVDNRQTCVRVDPVDDDIIYMVGPSESGGTAKDLRRYDGSAWKTNFGLVSRFRADNPGFPSHLLAGVFRIAIDPQDRNTVAVSIRAISYCSIYITYNALDTTPEWHNITENMQRIGALGLRFHPTNGDLWGGAIGGGTWVYPHPNAHPKPSWTPKLIVQNVDEAA